MESISKTFTRSSCYRLYGVRVSVPDNATNSLLPANLTRLATANRTAFGSEIRSNIMPIVS